MNMPNVMKPARPFWDELAVRLAYRGLMILGALLVFLSKKSFTE
jgi:hypothetical protein